MKAEKIELLSPAGDMECVIAAVKGGADAVYMGGKSFGARSSSKNFTPEELAEAVRHCHIRGVKVYVTVNTLVLNEEIDKLLEYIGELYRIDVDAIIVQDLGVLKLAKTFYEGLECHASTQMTIHNRFGAGAAKSLGMDRVVAAREMSLAEIGEIIEAEGPEVEAFVHGALCISYSGQCLMSSVIGGRSGNRGTCAQPCRRHYELVENDSGGEKVLDSGFLLSTKDLCSIDGLDKIAGSGITSLKIEGRMKRPGYVFQVTRFYNDALLAVEEGRADWKDTNELQRLKQVFNRKFTKGFIMGEDKGKLVNSESPGNRGIFIGKAIADAGGKVSLTLQEPLSFGDGIEFRRKNESFGCRMDNRNWRKSEAAPMRKGEVLELENKWRMRGAYDAFKTLDTELERNLAVEMNCASRRVPLKMKVRAVRGEMFSVSLEDGEGRTADAISEYTVVEAAKRPTDIETMKDKLERLGATAYEIGESDYDIDDKIYVPVSVMNETRRMAALKMDEARAVRHSGRRPVEIVVPEAVMDAPLHGGRKVSVTARTASQVEAALEAGADRIYYLGEKDLGGVLKLSEKVVYSPFKISGDKEIHGMIERVVRYGIKDVQVGNLGQLGALKDSNVKLHGDFSLNVANDHSLSLLSEAFPNLDTVCLSPELNLKQIKGFAPSAIRQEMVVYGKLPIMTLKHCPLRKSFGTCENADCENRNLILRDAKGYSFPMKLHNCHTVLYNSIGILTAARLLESPPEGVEYWRMELLDEDFKSAREIVNFHKKAIVDGDVDWRLLEKMKLKEYTRGHYFKSGV